jgi:hypothetical protein
MDLFKQIIELIFICIVRICRNNPGKTCYLPHRVNNSLDMLLETALTGILHGRKLDITTELIRCVGESGFDKYYHEAYNGTGHWFEVPSSTGQHPLIVHFPPHVSFLPVTVIDDGGDLQKVSARETRMSY